jgi:transcriptional regulator with XRE-family HTH domain
MQKMEHTLSFGQKIKKLRQEKGWSQEDLAKEIKVMQSLITYYEHDTKMPRPDTLVRIAKSFNVSLDYLLGLEDHTNLGEQKKDERHENLNNPAHQYGSDLVDVLENIVLRTLKKLHAEGKITLDEKIE